MKKREMAKGEFTMVVVLSIISVIAFILSLQMFLKDTKLSSMGAVPLLVSTIMVIMSVFMLLELRQLGRAFPAGVSLVEKLKAAVLDLFPPAVAIVIVYVVIYAVLLQFLGFTVSTFLFLAASMITLHRQQIVRSLIISAGILIGILIIFQYLFQVVLP